MAEDDIFYEQVAEEMLRGYRDPGLMAKAAGKSLGDNDLAQSLYIELRVLKLKEKAAEEARSAAAKAEVWSAEALKNAEIAQMVERVGAEEAERRPWMNEGAKTQTMDGLSIAGILVLIVALLMLVVFASCPS